MQQSQLISRLSLIRATIRRRLVAYGVIAVLASSVAAFIVVVAMDWMLHLPSLLRIVVSGAFLAGLLVATIHWILRPLHARLGIDEVAARLELHFGSLQDRLISSVDFLEHGHAGSVGMMQQVVANTERIVEQMPLESALTLRPLMRRGAMLAGSAALLTAILLVSPGWARTGLYRYILPWSPIEWPRTVSVLPLTGDQIVAVGDSITVRMRIGRGMHQSLRAVVHLREPDGSTITLAMQQDEDLSFYANVDTVTRNLGYWFEAGDDSTVHRPYTIAVAPRPQVIEALAEVEPPPYATNRSVRVQDLSIESVRAPIGGYVRVNLRTNKPIPPDPSGQQLGLRLESGELIPLTVDPQDHHRLFVRVKIDQDVHFRVELRDEHGFENRGALQRTILAIPDSPPTVTVLAPTAVTELTPAGSVPLVIRVEDDFGISRLDLNLEPIGGTAHTIPLLDRLNHVARDEGVEAVARYLWSVEPLSLSPGDTIVYETVATDNLASGETGGQIGRSASMHIKIISDVEFDIRLRSDIALLQTRIRRTALDQADLLDRTSALIGHGDQPPLLTDAQREIAAHLAARQARLMKRLRNLAGRFNQLTQRMERNHTGSPEDRIRIALLGEALQQTAAGPMNAAGVELSRSRELIRADSQQQTLQEAAGQQEAAIDRLHAMLRSMSQWGSFQELVTKTRDLLDRQGSLRTDTAKLGKAMLGKPVESLTENEAVRLKRAERRQGQLAQDVEQLLARMKQLATSTQEKDPSGADAVRAALRAGRAHDVTKHARSAAKAIGSNRTAAATIEQKAAAQAMRRMIAALKERESRELKQLRKQMEQAQQQVARLIEEQQALRSATHEAALIGPDHAAVGELELQQRALKRNTRMLGEELVETEQTAGAGRLVRQAATPMGQAEVELGKKQPESATQRQDEALELLNQAQERMEQIARESARRALRRSLAQIRENLEEILGAQRAVNGGIAKLAEAIEQRGRISRLEARIASKLARAQADIQSLVEVRLGDFGKVPVYEWALERVAQWMGLSRTRINARKIDEDLTAMTDRIVRELAKLIDAIVKTESLPIDTDFVESDKSGGGSGQVQADSGPPVPTVAELLLLKAMQIDINERTVELQQSINVDNVVETELQKLRVIGEDQAEVRRLAELVTKRVRHP